MSRFSSEFAAKLRARRANMGRLSWESQCDIMRRIFETGGAAPDAFMAMLDDPPDGSQFRPTLQDIAMLCK